MSAEKCKRSGDPETTFTQFYRSFPMTSEGPPGLGVTASPVVSWLCAFAKELKTFFETSARRKRADIRTQNECQERIEAMKNGFAMLKIALQLRWTANHIKLACSKYYFEKSKRFQFHRSFPVTSEGQPGLGVTASPVVSWLGTLAREFKTIYEMLSRK